MGQKMSYIVVSERNECKPDIHLQVHSCVCTLSKCKKILNDLENMQVQEALRGDLSLLENTYYIVKINKIKLNLKRKHKSYLTL